MKENREESTCKSIEKKIGKKVETKIVKNIEKNISILISYIQNVYDIPKYPTPEILIDSTGRGRGRFYWPGAVSEALETPGAL